MQFRLIVLVVFITSSFSVFAQYETGAEFCAEKKTRYQNLSSLNKTAERLIPHTFDVLDYNLKFDLYNNFIYPYPKSFNADEIITFKVDSVLNSISLDANNNSLTINSVSLAGVSFIHSSNILKVILDKSYNPGEIVMVGINYSHKDVNDGSFLVGGGFVLTDSEPERARNWFPGWDKPSDKATVNITAKVPSNVKLGSNGRLADSTLTGDTIYYNWISRDPVATYLVVLTGKVNYNLDIVEYTGARPNENFPIRFYWNSGENVTALNNVKKAMQPMTELFEQLFTKHPFEKNGFAAANSLFPWGGMENQSLTTICGNCWGNMGLIVHEYAHQWFGDMITCATWADLWLNEGFATYIESLWLEHTEGYGAYKALVDQTAAQYMNNNPGWAISNPEWVVNTPSINILFNYYITYMKGAVIHHLLRYTLGDQLYFAVMKAYADNPEFKYRSAAISDFISVVNSITGEDYNWFFDQWIYSPNHPAYENKFFIEDLGNNSWDVGFLANQNLRGNVFFKMPVEVKIYFAEGGDTLIKVMNDENKQLFRFNFSRQPSALEFDPYNNIVIKTASLTFIDPITSSEEPGLPGLYALDQNFPNPFNPVTIIKYEIPEFSNVTLTVYNLLGETIDVLVNRSMAAGKYEAAFDAAGIPSGIYIYKLDAGNYSSTKKMVLMK